MTRLALATALLVACGDDGASTDSGPGPVDGARGGTCDLDPGAVGCCYEDADCADGLLCRITPGCRDDFDPGVCVSPSSLADGQCWDRRDCGPMQLCEGAMRCPCGMACGAPDVPGTCSDITGCPVGPRAGCCFEDDDCGEGMVCRWVNECRSGGEGVCVTAPGEGECYVDAECGAGGSCENTRACTCGRDCTVTPAACAGS